MTGVTLPIVLSMMNVTAFVVVQESVEALPRATEVGLAERVQVGAPGVGGITTTVVVQITEPPGPVAVPV